MGKTSEISQPQTVLETPDKPSSEFSSAVLAKVLGQKKDI
jgi:hypothetical protein